MSYDRNFQHVIVVQEYMTKGSLKDMIYKKVHGVCTCVEYYWHEAVCIRNYYNNNIMCVFLL